MAEAKYYLYSANQAKLRKESESKIGKTYQLGTLIKNGRRLLFTEVSSNGKSIYSDAKVIYYGDPDKIKIVNMPRSIFGGRRNGT